MEPAAAPRRLSPTAKLALDFGPILAFFAGYLALREQSFHWAGRDYDGFVVVTACFVPLLALTTWLTWHLTRRLSKMNLVTLFVVVIFGGLTVWFNDERFFKMKPTMIYAIFAFILLAGLVRGKSYLQMVMDEVLPMQPAGWMILTRRLTGFFAGLAVLNEVIWRNFSTGTWVGFKTFGLTAAVFLFFLAQGRLFETYAADRRKGEGP
jgi:intracellular septation protein